MVKKLAVTVGLMGLFLSAMCLSARAAGGLGGFGRGLDSDEDAVYVVYKEADYYGNVKYSVGTREQYDAQRDAVKQLKLRIKGRKLYVGAFLEAKKAWIADPEHENVPFPLRSVKAPLCLRRREFEELVDANSYLDRLREREDRKKEKEENLRKRKLAAMSQAKREKAEEKLAKRAELLEQAKNLYQEKVTALLDKVQGKKTEE